jgi:hypothetical protein
VRYEGWGRLSDSLVLVFVFNIYIFNSFLILCYFMFYSRVLC